MNPWLCGPLSFGHESKQLAKREVGEDSKTLHDSAHHLQQFLKFPRNVLTRKVSSNTTVCIHHGGKQRLKQTVNTHGPNVNGKVTCTWPFFPLKTLSP